jgi:hypothetical protein
MFSSMASAVVLALMPCAGPAQAPARNVVTTESTTTATVDRIERSTRVVTFRSEGNVVQDIYVDPSVKAFDDLQKGDVVTVRYVESTVVQVRPGAALSDARDVTAEAQKAGNPQVVQQRKAVVTIESVNPQDLAIEYRTQDGRKIANHVSDKRLLEGLRVGDRIEVTLTRERAISVERVRR